jgi:hypothetical protein
MGRALPKGRKLEELNEFVEVDNGILRVRGRLSGSAFFLLTPLIVDCCVQHCMVDHRIQLASLISMLGY